MPKLVYPITLKGSIVVESKNDLELVDLAMEGFALPGQVQSLLENSLLEQVVEPLDGVVTFRNFTLDTPALDDIEPEDESEEEAEEEAGSDDDTDTGL